MKFLLVFLFTTFSYSAVDKSTANDVQHIVFFSAIPLMTTEIAYHQYGLTPTHAALIGWTTAVLMGLGKEYLIDTNADPRDMRSNAIGATIGVLPIFRYKF